jgi:hypothetical protein
MKIYNAIKEVSSKEEAINLCYYNYNGYGISPTTSPVKQGQNPLSLPVLSVN